MKYIRDHGITSLASWTRYDADALRLVFEEARIPMIFVDACQRTRNCVIWHTYRLHEFYNAFFQTTPSEDFIEGYVAGLYADHVIIPNIECPHCPTPEEAIEQIKVRNKADILQMVEICMKLWDG